MLKVDRKKDIKFNDLPNRYIVFAAMRFVSGMSHAGMFIMAFGLAVEYTGPRWRVFTGCLIETPFAIGKHTTQAQVRSNSKYIDKSPTVQKDLFFAQQ